MEGQDIHEWILYYEWSVYILNKDGKECNYTKSSDIGDVSQICDDDWRGAQ